LIPQTTTLAQSSRRDNQIEVEVAVHLFLMAAMDKDLE